MSSIKSLLEANVETKSTSSSQMKKKMTIPKDPHAPKKPLTAYNLYAAEQRVKVDTYTHTHTHITHAILFHS